MNENKSVQAQGPSSPYTSRGVKVLTVLSQAPRKKSAGFSTKTCEIIAWNVNAGGGVAYDGEDTACPRLALANLLV